MSSERARHRVWAGSPRKRRGVKCVAKDSSLIEMFSSLRVDGEARRLLPRVERASEALYAGSRARRFSAPERDTECN